MGMSIEEKFKTLRDEYTHLAAKYLMMQADYENRLKADMVAMLTDIQSEIRHFMYDVNPSSSESDYACNYMIDIIQQKINSLKAEIEPQESEVNNADSTDNRIDR